MLRQQVEMLGDRGRRAIDAAARHDALIGAVIDASRAAPVVPLFLLVLALIRPIGASLVLNAAILAPLGVLGWSYVRRMMRHSVMDASALALVDHTLALKDRARTTSEFLQREQRGGFHEAALAEAQPWLQRASDASLGDVSAARTLPRSSGVMVCVALALTILALVVDHHADASDRSTARPLAGLARAIGLDAASSNNEDRSLVPENADRAAGGGPIAASGGGASLTGRSLREGGSARGGAGNSGSGDGAATRPDDDASADNLGAAGGPASGDGAAGGRAGDGGSAPAGSAQKSDRSGVRQPGDAPDMRGASQSSAEALAAPPVGSRSAGLASSSQAGSPPPQSSGGNDARQGSGRANRQSRSQQSSGSGGEGRNNGGRQGSNRSSGQEGVKRARGLSSMMLGVPMEDRVIGTVNSGQVSTTLRDAAPRAIPAGTVAAGSRGRGQAMIGAVDRAPRTAQEDRVLERYFKREGVE